MIALNAIVLIIQSARDVAVKPRVTGYFHSWEDYVLIAVFGVFTVEIVARIVVSGLVINPPALPNEIPEVAVPDHDAAYPVLSEKSKSDTKMRRRKSESNTLESLTTFGDVLKRSAQKALSPDEFGTRRHDDVSPNREGFAPRPFDYFPAGSKAPDGAEGHFSSRGPVPPTSFSHPRDATYTSSAMQSTLSQPFRQTKADDFLARQNKIVPFAEAIVLQRAKAPYYAYLRHSWNRIDFIAVIAFWAMFCLAITRQEMTDNYHIFLFRAISVLRCARLLTVTSGTATILASLKQAGPLLVNVSFFTVFALLLFSVIGTQSFKGSYRRQCVWVSEWNPNSFAGSSNTSLGVICGSYTDFTTGQVHGHLRADGTQFSKEGKGYQCPLGQICLEAENGEGGAQGFDNIFLSLLETVIMISANGWSQTMYDMIFANYFAAAVFFILGLIITNFWLANLFVAVITNTFASITSQTNRSAFAAEEVSHPAAKKAVSDTGHGRRTHHAARIYRKFIEHTRWIWLAAITVDLGLQASTDWTEEQFVQVLDFNLWFAIAFDVEILIRISSYLMDGDWYAFFSDGRNCFDTALSILCSISQIPPIKLSPAFPWMTVFSLARFYRVILAVPRMAPLLNALLGSVTGLLNMILFLFITVGLTCLMALQLFRGDIPAESDGQPVEMTFKHTWNSFLAMYQVRTRRDLGLTALLTLIASLDLLFRKLDHCPVERSLERRAMEAGCHCRDISLWMVPLLQL